MGDAILLTLFLAVAVGAAVSWARKPGKHEGFVKRVDSPVRNMRHFIDITDLDENLKDYIEQEIKWAKEHHDETTKKD